MAKLHLTGKELRAIGYPEGPVISVAMNVMEKQYKHNKKEAALNALRNILAEPAMFVEDEALSPIAKLLLPKEKTESDEIALLNNGVHFNVFGAEYIEEGALQQMHAAAKLPVSIAGALMPDAHSWLWLTHWRSAGNRKRRDTLWRRCGHWLPHVPQRV